jgi:predicted RNase H-like nuclease (RuvC/YqgF family)
VAVPGGEKKRIFDVIRELIDCATELEGSDSQNSNLKKRLSALKKQLFDLKKELSEYKNAADSDDPLLASGLRLALANEALKIEIAELRKDAAKLAPHQKAGRGSPEQPERTVDAPTKKSPDSPSAKCN